MAHHTDGYDVEYLEEDYYSLLNLRRNANSEDITNAYRRLSRLYHPDKHSDPIKKKNAEILFNKTKRAYEVLTDPHKRAIYDTLGVKGLDTEGWEIVQRTKTPQEIRDEYEQLIKEREERQLQQRTNPKGVISVGVDATDLFEQYGYDSSFAPHFEISSMTISQSVEAPLSLSDTLTLNGSLTTQNGTGSGSIGCSLRRVMSAKTWMEFEIGAGNGLIFTIKGFRTLSKKCFGTFQGVCHFTSLGVRPGLQAVLARQLDKHTCGYLTWKGGQHSSMNSTVVWDTINGHFVGSLQIGIQSTFIMASYIHKLPEEAKVRGLLKLGTFGAIVEYGCEKKISQHSTVGASMVIGIPSGITLKLKVNRARQTYVFPIFLSEEIIPSAVFYGTFAPVLGWYILKVFIINPYQERQKKREAEKMQEANATKLAERKKEATMTVALMQETYNRIKQQEETKGGLVINLAIYGSPQEICEDEISTQNEKVVNVTVQLQCLVKDSRLVLPETSKSNLPGFYDPCIGEDKSLFVKYSFRNLQHSILVDNYEMLKIPNEPLASSLLAYITEGSYNCTFLNIYLRCFQAVCVCQFCPRQKETRWECKKCGASPLHPEGCFEIDVSETNLPTSTASLFAKV